MTVATWLSGDQTRDRELDDGNVSQQDLNEGYQEVDSSISGTDLGLSVEREITPWSTKLVTLQGNGEPFLEKLSDQNNWLGSLTSVHRKSRETNGGPDQPTGGSGCGTTSATEDEADKHLNRPTRAQAGTQ